MKKASLTRFLLLFSLLTAFTNAAHPITPTVINNLHMPDYMFGVSFSMMSVTYFLFAPLWGKVSDRIGRTKTLALMTIGNSVGQLIFGLANGAIMLVAGRMITGMFACGYHVSAMAYVADISEPDQVGRNTSYYAAFNSVSAAAGYLLGGLLGDLGIPLTFTVQIIGLLTSGVLFALFLDNKQEYDTTKSVGFDAVNPFKAFYSSKAMWTPMIALLFVGVFAASFATNGYDNAFNYYIKAELGFPPSYNGIIKAVVGLIGLIANFTINLWLVKKTDTSKSIIWVFALCAGSLMTVVWATGSISFIILNIVFYLFNAIYLPIQQAIVVNCTDRVSNGVKLGMFNSIRALGMMLGPLVAGFAYSTSSTLPFVFSSIAFALAFVSSLILYLWKRKAAKSNG